MIHSLLHRHCRFIVQNAVSYTHLDVYKRQKIYFKYGNSQKSMLSPYQFEYDLGDTVKNPRYNVAEKDRWGNYKPNNSSQPNYEYPFVNQEDANNDKYAAAWSLQRITLPSGGVIEVNYEADDYAYVQDKKVMEMFKVQGVGNTCLLYTSRCV